ncbi:MAG: Ig-like domain-containing protein, partial [Planctomycetota bacterium]
VTFKTAPNFEAPNDQNSDGVFLATVEVSDGGGGVATLDLRVAVLDQNEAPIGAADVYSLDEDGALNVAAGSGVLANDVDPEGDALSAALEVNPAHGTVALGANGSFTYTPGDHFHGADGFSYRVSDGLNSSAVVAVTVNVSSINDAPIVSAPAAPLEATEQIGLAIHSAGFTVADVDEAGGGAVATLSVDEGALTIESGDSGVSVESGNGTAAVTLRGDIAQIDNLLTGAGSGTIIYLNDNDAPSNSTTLVVTVNDLGNAGADPGSSGDSDSEQGVAQQQINIAQVNDNPVVTSYGGAAVAEVNTAEGETAVAAVDAVDPEGRPIVYRLVGGADLALFDIDSASGVLRFKEGPDFESPRDANADGVYETTVQVEDGVGGLATQQFRVTVFGENEPPVGAPDSYEANEDVPLSISAGSGVLTNDEDLDGDPVTAQLQSGATHGAVVLNADGSFEYTPDSDFNGADS